MQNGTKIALTPIGAIFIKIGLLQISLLGILNK
jgi:hypothetical protein